MAWAMSWMPSVEYNGGRTSSKKEFFDCKNREQIFKRIVEAYLTTGEPVGYTAGSSRRRTVAPCAYHTAPSGPTATPVGPCG